MASKSPRKTGPDRLSLQLDRTNAMRSINLLFAAALSIPASAGVIVLEGNYQGKNLFIQNPFSEAGVGFCVFEVTVNDQIATDEINSSAFEIDMNNFGLKLSDKVVVKVKHKDGCTPVVLNPEVLKPKSTFDIVKQAISADGTYTWTTTNETGELPFIVEQKRWNKWVKAGEVMGIGQARRAQLRVQGHPAQWREHLPHQASGSEQTCALQRSRQLHLQRARPSPGAHPSPRTRSSSAAPPCSRSTTSMATS
jgi:hypothetical protein